MVDDEKLIEESQALKDYCAGRKERCEGCLFSFKVSGYTEIFCGITSDCGVPSGWKIPLRRRWSELEKAFAIGLKAKGYSCLTRELFTRKILAIGMGKASLDLGKDWFNSIVPEEVVKLDDIIAEGEKQ